MLTCTPERPWGIHVRLLSDEDCPRCGWTAPGPKGDALADAIEAEAQARALAAVLGWTLRSDEPPEALAA